MLFDLLRKIKPNRNLLLKRSFEEKLFLNDEHQNALAETGYVRISKGVENEDLDTLKEIYHSIESKYHFFSRNPNFLNTMALDKSDVKKEIRDATSPVVSSILSGFLDTVKIRFPFGAAYCINPPDAVLSCKPHQDPAYVDETKSYSLIIWIPLEDINLHNGCLHVIPRSHLWNNPNRSISMDWAFEPYSNLLWEKMIPIETKKGDVVIFDAALLHGSNVNKSSSDRLAVNIPVLPVSQKMITFFPTKKNWGVKYEIDESYYLDEFLLDRPSNRFKVVGNIKLNNLFCKSDVDRMLKLIKK